MNLGIAGRCLLLVSLGVASNARAEPCRDERLSRPIEYIRRLIRDDSIPSIAIGVAIDGRLLCTEAFGYAHVSAQVKARSSTRYAVASVAKPFVATGVMLLVERGKLSLDSSANRYLPAQARIKGRAADAGAITLRHLLQHRAGLPSPHVTRFLPGQSPGVLQAIDRYAVVVDPPGERYAYSNLGYGILAFLSSRAAGKPYDRFLREQIFQPLGLHQTTLEIGPGLSRPAAVLYGDDNHPLPYYVFDEWGSGRIWSTPGDLVKFGLWHLGVNRGQQRTVLSDKGRARMVTDRQSTGSAAGPYGLDWFYALGWGGRDSTSVSPLWYGHDGGMPGSSADLKIFPSRSMVVVVLSNSPRAPARALTDSIAHALVPKWAEMRRNDPLLARKPEKPEPFAPPRELTGEWEGQISSWNGDVPVRLTLKPDSTIHLRLGKSAPLKATEPTWEDERLTFDADARLDTPDLRRFPEHTLWFNLRLRGDSLSGAVTAYTSTSQVPSVALPSPVSLRRVIR